MVVLGAVVGRFGNRRYLPARTAVALSHAPDNWVVLQTGERAYRGADLYTVEALVLECMATAAISIVRLTLPLM